MCPTQGLLSPSLRFLCEQAVNPNKQSRTDPESLAMGCAFRDTQRMQMRDDACPAPQLCGIADRYEQQLASTQSNRFIFKTYLLEFMLVVSSLGEVNRNHPKHPSDQ